MILLLNATVMPTEGNYTLRRISKATFRETLRTAAETNNFQSYIGYPETANLIEQLTGIPIQVSREPATLTPGDIMLIVKLRHRVAAPTQTQHISIRDLEFYHCTWQPLTTGERHT